ncbi:MAG: hypothetical protein AAGA03_13810, partial [Planctomycetota bacterium]
AAVYLAFGIKQERLLIAFFPLCFVPILAGCFSTLASMLSSISMQLDADNELAMDSAFLLQMAFVPLIVSVLASSPPSIVTAVGRWLAAWRDSGVAFVKPPKPEAKTVTEEETVAREADDYLDRLVRPR